MVVMDLSLFQRIRPEKVEAQVRSCFSFVLAECMERRWKVARSGAFSSLARCYLGLGFCSKLRATHVVETGSGKEVLPQTVCHLNAEFIGKQHLVLTSVPTVCQ